MNLLEQEASEGLDSRAQESTMEWHINTLQWDGGETTLEIKWFGLGLSLLSTLIDDLDQVSFDILERHALHQLLDVNLLCLEIIGDVGETVKSAKVTSTDVLHIGDVVVDNLKKPAGLFRDILNNILKCLFVEGLGDSAGVDSTLSGSMPSAARISIFASSSSSSSCKSVSRSSCVLSRHFSMYSTSFLSLMMSEGLSMCLC